MRLLCGLPCLSLTFLVALHDIPLSFGCSPMLGISLICCAVLAEHVSSNASDSDSSYRKLLLWFVILFFATAPLPVVFISDFCCCFFNCCPLSSSSKANGLKWNHHLMWKDTKDMRAMGELMSFVQGVVELLINYSSLSWLWPGDAILLEKVGGRDFFLDFDILSSKNNSYSLQKGWKVIMVLFSFSFCLFLSVPGSPLGEKAW